MPSTLPGTYPGASSSTALPGLRVEARALERAEPHEAYRFG